MAECLCVEVPCLGHCDLAPVGTRGDTILPGLVEGAVTHAANDGPSTGLAQADETLADYERRGGLEALRAEHSNEAVLAELEASGLVGYGGAGFPTFRKWATVVQFAGPRVVVVNADEGEPGTIKDRYVMELRPHLLRRGHGDRGPLRRGRARDRLSARGVRDCTSSAAIGNCRVPLGRVARVDAGGDRDRRRLLRLRGGDGDARVAGGPPRHASPATAVPGRIRLSRPARR